jgi:hypothetical protein
MPYSKRALSAARVPVLACCAFALLVAAAPRATTATADDGPVRVWNHTWRCDSPQSGTQVEVRITDGQPIDAVHIDEGCTGQLDIRVYTNGADGIKLHTGAHDLQITGNITCDGRYGERHQDGVQAMGGSNIQLGDGSHLGSFWVYCPSGNNGALFTNSGIAQHSTPTDIICDACDLYENNVAVHIGADSNTTGARDSILHLGTSDASPDDACMRIAPDAAQPVDQGNRCVPADDRPPSYPFNPGLDWRP